MIKRTTKLLPWAFCLVTLAGATLALAQLPGGRPGFVSPMVSGTVTQVNAGYHAIQVQSDFGDQSEWVGVATDATIQGRVPVDLSTLREGDRITVSGWPSTIAVAEITEGSIAPLFAAPPVAPGPPGQPPQPPRRVQQPQPPSTTGRILSLNPLKIAVEAPSEQPSATPGAPQVLAEITLEMRPESKALRIADVDFSGIKVGDQVVAAGQRDDRGGLTASRVLLNMGGMMRGMGMGMGMGRRGGGGMGRGGAGGGGGA